MLSLLATAVSTFLFSFGLVANFWFRWSLYDGIVIDPDYPITPRYEAFKSTFWHVYFGPICLLSVARALGVLALPKTVLWSLFVGGS